MSKKLKQKSITLKFTITRYTDRATGEHHYRLMTEGADDVGGGVSRPVTPTWFIDGEEPEPNAHDAVHMAYQALWAAVMGANL